MILPRWFKLAAVGFAVLIGAAMAFAIFEPIQVLPRIRLAPGYSLTTADGATMNSELGRGTVTLYSFATTDCGDRCDEMFDTLRQVQDRVVDEVDLGAAEFRVVTIALDPVDGPAELAAAAEASGADGIRWQWIGGDATSIRRIVGTGFRRFFEESSSGEITFDPSFVIVDGNGVVRGDYRYQTLADDADKLIRHTEILAEEIRYADGPAALAYEAAHLFLCYP